MDEQLFSDAVEGFLARLEADGLDVVSIKFIRRWWLPKIIEQAEAKREEYNELIMAVGSKHEGETRHETALRYIRERENQDSRVATSLRERSGDEGR